MSAAHKQYAKEMKKKFGYYATWTPGTPLELGDVGYLENNIFRRKTTLKDLGIEFPIRPDSTKEDLEHNSSGSVTITAKAAGTVAPAGSSLGTVDAGLIVEFGSENSVLFKAKGAATNSIRSITELEKDVFRLYESGIWEKELVIITDLVMADSSTVLICNSTSGKIELKAEGDLQVNDLDIADASIGLSTSFSKGLQTQIIAREGLTPLFRAMGLKSRFFRRPGFGPRSLNTLEGLTPQSLGSDYSDQIFLGYISDDERE